MARPACVHRGGGEARDTTNDTPKHTDKLCCWTDGKSNEFGMELPPHVKWFTTEYACVAESVQFHGLCFEKRHLQAMNW